MEATESQDIDHVHRAFSDNGDPDGGGQGTPDTAPASPICMQGTPGSEPHPPPFDAAPGL